MKRFINAFITTTAEFQQFTHQHSAIMLLIDPHARVILDCNTAAAEFYGYPIETFRGLSVELLNVKPESEMMRLRQRVLDGEVNQFEVDHYLANGEVRTVVVLTSPIIIDHQQVLLSIVNDVTAARLVERELAEQYKRLIALESEQRQLLLHLHSGIVVYAPDGAVIFSNPAAARLLGLTEDALSKTSAFNPAWSVVDETGKPLPINDFPAHQVIANHQPIEGLVLGVKRGDEVVWLLTHVFPEFNAEGALIKVVANFNDITQQKRLQEKLENLAQTDDLTKLNNRRNFMRLATIELTRAIRYKKPLSLFMIDIDYFKKINDSYGHHVGDLVLEKLAQVCHTALREVDLIGRIGGEEFAVVLPETSTREATEIAERLRAAIERNKVEIGDEVFIACSVSIGVASLHTDEDTLDSIMARADGALYRAKDAGRNQVMVQADI